VERTRRTTGRHRYALEWCAEEGEGEGEVGDGRGGGGGEEEDYRQASICA
jgi:hypothetical protein